MTLSEQTNNTTSNTPHVVRHSDSLFPSHPRFFGSFAFIFASALFACFSFAPPGCVGWGPFAPVGIFLMVPPRPACPFFCAVLLFSCCFCRPLSLLWLCVPFGASPFWAHGFPVCCFRLCVSWFPFFLLCSFVSVGGSRIFWLGDWLLLAPLPVSCHLPFPLGWSRVAPWSSFHAGTSLWVSGCSCDGSVALPLCWECGCALSSFLHFVSWQQRLLSPVWDCYHPLHHVAGAVRMLSLTTLRYSSGR